MFKSCLVHLLFGSGLRSYNSDNFIRSKSPPDFTNSLNDNVLRLISYNATAWLQSLEIGPTILLMHESISEISHEWNSLFVEMKKVGLIIDRENLYMLDSLQNQNEIIKWWQSDSVMKARNNFISSYMYNG